MLKGEKEENKKNALLRYFSRIKKQETIDKELIYLE